MTKHPGHMQPPPNTRRPGWLRGFAAVLAVALLLALTPGLRASVIDCSAPLQDVQVQYVGGQVTCQVFDPAQGQWMSISTPSATAFNLINTNGVVAWSSGSLVFCQTYDPFRTNWATVSYAATSVLDLKNSRGLIAWSTSAKVTFTTYDPMRGAWIAGEMAPGGPFDLRVRDGVVSWTINSTVFLRTYDPARGLWFSDALVGSQPTYDFTSAGGVATWSVAGVIHYRSYDAWRGAWTGQSALGDSINSPVTADGVVAWPVGGTVSCTVYDPVLGSWVGTNANPHTGFASGVTITNGTVTWSTGFLSTSCGYNPAAKGWLTGSSRALAFFAISTNAGPAPLFVRFTDMSLGAITREWDFGGGLKSLAQSPSHTFSTPGLSLVKQTIAGIGGSSVLTTNILSDVLAPTNTSVVIDGGKTFTTNQNVALTLTATDNGGGALQMRFSNDKSIWSAWEAFSTTKAWKLAPGYGQRTVWAQFRDTFENASEPVSDSILLDSTAPPTANFAVSETNVIEGNVTLTIPVQLDHPMQRRVSVAYATTNLSAIPDVDYEPTSGRLVFESGMTLQNVSVRILGDAVVETNKQFQILLFDGVDVVPGPPVTVTILDNDVPSVRFAAEIFTAVENSGAGTLTVELSQPSGLTVSVNYAATNGTATAGVDFAPVTGTLTFPPGETTGSILVPLSNDSLDELPETVIATLSSPTNAVLVAPSTATLRILDDDPPTVNFTAAEYETTQSAGTATADVRLTKPYSQTIYVDYATGGGTAVPGLDYIASSGTLIFPPGQTNRTITVTILPGAQPGPARTFRITLSGFVNVYPGATTTTTVTIVGDGELTLAPLGFTPEGAFRLRLSGPPGTPLQLQRSADLVSWSDLAVVPNPTGTTEYLDATAPQSEVRYYRARQSP